MMMESWSLRPGTILYWCIEPGCDVKQRSRMLSPLVGSRIICCNKKSWANWINDSWKSNDRYDSVRPPVPRSIPGQLKFPLSRKGISGSFCLGWETQRAKSSQTDTGLRLGWTIKLIKNHTTMILAMNLYPDNFTRWVNHDLTWRNIVVD